MNPDRDAAAIRYATAGDEDFWFTLDRHLSRDEYARKVRDRMGYVLTLKGRPAGVLRYSLFWDSIPFCNMLYVAKEYRGRGYGKQLMEHWEKDMKSNGCGMVMTSTQVNEDAQNFYRKLGFKESGGFVIDVPGYEQPMEMIMIKAI
ncbi:MAG: GNAT family N-acetyltransferase [Clostridia bacterium]|nr:GNAT family N-acetyltransferase [Clostridia bacterium]